MEVQYKIPTGLMERFVSESFTENKSNNHHNATFAFITGHWEESVLVAKVARFAIFKSSLV